jgi:hypothetical protein
VIEILVGYPLLQVGIKLWDYSYLSTRKQWKGIISFIHFPVWIILGIVVEQLKQILV